MKTMKRIFSAVLMAAMLLTCFVATAEPTAPIALENMYGEDVESVAAALGLTQVTSEDDEALMSLYENDDVNVGSVGGVVISITYLGGDYTLCGVQIGMTMDEVKAVLEANGIEYEENMIVEIEVPTIDFALPGNEEATVSLEFCDDLLCGAYIETPIDTISEEEEPEEEAAEKTGGETVSVSTEAAAKVAGYIRTTGSVHLRKTANKESKSLGTIASGAKMKYSATQKDWRGVVWYKVNYKGKTGWVSSKYSKKISQKEFNEKDHHRPGKEKKASGVIRLTGAVNVRKAPDKTSQSLRVFGQGAELKYTAIAKDNRGVTWYKVTADGVTGWISSKFAKKI